NAAKVRLFDRGLLRPGAWADVTVFDPAAVIDRATFEDPHRYPAGIEYVVVNGAVVIERGRHTAARPGVVLYGPGKRRRAEARGAGPGRGFCLPALRGILRVPRRAARLGRPQVPNSPSRF